MESLNSSNIHKTRAEILVKTVEREIHDGGHETNLNYDPVSYETYSGIFGRLIRQGDIILNLGAGVALDPIGGANHLNHAVLEACEKKGALLVPVDMHHANLISHQDLKEITGSKQLTPLEADARELPLEDASVAGIVSSNLINDPVGGETLHGKANKIVAEAWRVLRPGGFVTLSSFGYVVEGKDKHGATIYNNDITHSDIFTLKDLERVLEAQGFVRIAELELDAQSDQYFEDEYGRKIRSIEGGGFIAYKPSR